MSWLIPSEIQTLEVSREGALAPSCAPAAGAWGPQRGGRGDTNRQSVACPLLPLPAQIKHSLCSTSCRTPPPLGPPDTLRRLLHQRVRAFLDDVCAGWVPSWRGSGRAECCHGIAGPALLALTSSEDHAAVQPLLPARTCRLLPAHLPALRPPHLLQASPSCP